MARLLIVYGTTDGHTRTIADFIAKRIEAAGDDVQVSDSTSIPPPVCSIDYDAYILLGSIHEGHLQKSLVHFAQANRDDLQRHPSALFSVSLAAAIDNDEHRAETNGYIQTFIESTGWAPLASWSVAGALLYTEYNFLKRMLMKMIVSKRGGDTDTSRDYEYTDWDELGRCVDEFLAMHVHPAVTLQS